MPRTPPAGKGARRAPPGTVIDDGARLALLRAQLAADAALKPTAAIRALGITDPASIRRLRDKLKRVPAPLCAAPPEPAAAAQPEPAQAAPETRRPTPAAGPEAATENIRRAGPPPHAAAEPPHGARQSHAAGDPLMIGSLEFAIRAWATAVTTQLGMMTLMLQNPVVRQTLHQQIAFNEMMMSLMRPPKSPRR